MRDPTMTAWLAILTLGVVACGGESAEDPPPPAEPAVVSDAPPGEAYRAVDVADGGAIRGTVRFVGRVPASRSVAVPDGAEACGTVREVQRVVTNANGGLRDAVVSLVDIRRGAAPEAPPSPPVLDQRECVFVPHVLAVPAGGAVAVRNSDPLTHNVHTASFENRSVNRSQPAGMDEMTLTFQAPERVRVQCDLHPWMEAWIVVTGHPYYSITDEAGSFVLSGIPPGTYTLEIWHEALGARTRTVTVVAGETAELHVELTGQG